MTRGRFTFFLLSTVCVVPILAGALFGTPSDKPSSDSLYKYLAVFTEALGLVDQAYVEESDDAVLLAGALDGLTDALDPFALYVPAPAVAAYTQAREVGTARSGLWVLRERGVDYVLNVEPGSPASGAGVRPGDLLAEIQGRSTRTMPLWEVHQILGGAVGTEIKLRLLRYADPVDATFRLGEFTRGAVRHEAKEGADVLTVTSFDGTTVAAVRAALAQTAARGVDRLLIDLRGASGGDPAAAYAVAALFAEGELGRLTGREGGEIKVIQTFQGAAPLFRGRLVVLTGRATVGAAEILAAVLRQRAQAEVVGERTFGYAGRQKAIELSSGARLFLTDAFYSGPDGNALREAQRPDLAVEAREPEAGSNVPPPDNVLERGLQRLTQAEQPAAEKKAA